MPMGVGGTAFAEGEALRIGEAAAPSGGTLEAFDRVAILIANSNEVLVISRRASKCGQIQAFQFLLCALCALWGLCANPHSFSRREGRENRGHREETEMDNVSVRSW
jgi:hypothetical protein